MKCKHLFWGLAVVLLVLVAAPPRGVAQAAQRDAPLDRIIVDLQMPFPENPEQVEEILQRIEENALDIRQSAVRVIQFVEQPGAFTWLTHAWRLNRTEERIADLRAALDRLNRRTDVLLDGQREAFELIEPLTEALAADLATQIDYLEQRRSRPLGPRYTELAAAIRDGADQIVSATRLAESLGEVREQLNQLEAGAADSSND